MDKKLYDAAVKGNQSLLDGALSTEIDEDGNFVKETFQKNNMIHLAVRHEPNVEFLKAALTKFPTLIYGQNSDGNTPLHIASEVARKSTVELLISEEVVHGQEKPWRIKNAEGNSPLHVALINCKADVATLLIKKDSSLTKVPNNSKETPLHLAVKHQEDDDKQSVSATMKLLVYRHGTSMTTDGCGVGEDLFPVIKLLLHEESSVACLPDAHGLTPLLRAALLKKPSNSQIIKIILDHCPQSAEVRDRSGRTILHLLNKIPSYQEGKKLLDFPEIFFLRNFQDNRGDTPMHIAARNKDINLVRVLLESSVNLAIKNKKGISAAAVLKQHTVFQDHASSKVEEVEGTRKMTMEEIEAAENVYVTFLSEKLNKLGIDFLISQAPGGGNILHMILKRIEGKDRYFDFEDFLRRAVEKFPLIICHRDFKGNNALHILAQSDTKCARPSDAGKYAVNLLEHFHKHFQEAIKEAGTGIGVYYPPWRVKNVNGDTPIHVALKAKSYRFARKLLKLDRSLAGYVNNYNETPLHLLSSYDAELMGTVKVWFVINMNADAAYERDQDGLTPLLRAARDHNFQMIEDLCIHCPQSAGLKDLHGRTFWHMIANRPLSNSDHNKMNGAVKSIFENNDIKGLLKSKDSDGNRPLYLVIKNRNFDLAQLILDKGVIVEEESSSNYEQRTRKRFLEEENVQGSSSSDLIGSAEHLPPKFEEFLWKQRLLSGYRSMYGVPSTKIEQYISAIGVTAALLATITFTAAFTVPGGLDASSGSPLLLKKAAFQVFMISDVLAMCLSMMVLFCLLWIMTTAHKKESLMLLDVSVFLLQSSFYVTLLTFMTGLYVTTIHIAPAIAIFSCAICSLLILLMHKGLVTLALVPFCAMLITIFGSAGKSITRRMRTMTHRMPDSNHHEKDD